MYFLKLMNCGIYLVGKQHMIDDLFSYGMSSIDMDFSRLCQLLSNCFRCKAKTYISRKGPVFYYRISFKSYTM